MSKSSTDWWCKRVTIVSDGKYLEDLVYEVDTLHKPIIASGNNQACICWQEDGTLAYFDYVHGLSAPGFYYSEATGDSQDNYTSLTRFTRLLRIFDDCDNDAYHYMLTQPVWKVLEAEDEANREAFNVLLADIDIDL
jgi:hypothetical protein